MKLFKNLKSFLWICKQCFLSLTMFVMFKVCAMFLDPDVFIETVIERLASFIDSMSLSSVKVFKRSNRDFKKPRQQHQRKQSWLENISWHYLYYFAIIPIHSTCKVWLNYPVTEQVRMVLKFRQRIKYLLTCAHVLHKTLNLGFSCCRLVEYSEEMYQNSKCMCRAIVLLIKSYLL